MLLVCESKFNSLFTCPIFTVPRLKELFLCWSLLDSEERVELDYYINTYVSSQRIQLYMALKEALRRWELVQDTQGKKDLNPSNLTFILWVQLIFVYIRSEKNLFKKSFN